MTFRVPSMLMVALVVLTTTATAHHPLEHGSIPPVLLQDPNPLLARQDYRLPLEVTPVSYIITLTPSLKEGTFEGNVEIVTTPQPGGEVKTITLHAHSSLNIGTVDVKYKEETVGITLPPEGTNKTNDFFVISLNDPINDEEGGSVVVTVKYTGSLLNGMTGFYRSSYLNNGLTEFLATTQLEATDARKVFPCFDEPALKATFQLTVVAPPGYSALSNTPTVGDPTVDAQGALTYTFKETPLMSTYLLATVVSKFEKSQTHDMNNNVWSRPNSKDQRNFASSVAASVMDAVKTITGHSYTRDNINKMDNVAIPDFGAGAMENWGLVTYRETRLLVSYETPMAMKKKVAGDLAHEYGHQLFGDLVTPKWWNSIWLNEGFASYIEYHAYALVNPTWRMDEQFVVDEVHQALEVDSRITTRAMTVDEDTVLTQTQISRIFDDIAYAKGGAFVRMIEHIIGTETFRKGLKNYLIKMTLKAATQDDLFDAMGETAVNLPLGGFSLKQILESWTNTVGYPLLTVIRNYNTSTATVIQTRFVIFGPATGKPMWITPVNWATSSEEFRNTKPTLWLSQEETLTFPVEEPLLNSSTWVVVNNQRTGFYRVNYDEENWRMLTEQLQSNASVFPPVTQAQLIDDGFALARSGKLNYSVALGLTLYLENEDDIIPWTAALNSFNFIKDRLTGSSYYEYFQKYMHKIIGPVFSTMSDFAVGDSITDLERLFISKIVMWECQLGNSQCTAKSKSVLDLMNDQGISQVSPDVRGALYCEAVRSGGADVWNGLWTQYTKTIVASEEMVVLQALACSTDAEILKQYLVNATNGEGIREQDFRTVYTAVCNNPAAFDVLAEFVNQSFSDEHPDRMTDIIMCLASKANTEEQMHTVTRLGLQVNIDVSQIAGENIMWLQQNEETVGEWLKENSSGTKAKLTTFSLVAVVLVVVNSILGY